MIISFRVMSYGKKKVEGSLRTFTLTERFVLGRNEQCQGYGLNLGLYACFVSRNHGVFEPWQKGWRFTDTSSAGTWYRANSRWVKFVELGGGSGRTPLEKNVPMDLKEGDKLIIVDTPGKKSRMELVFTVVSL
jgi:hypothetical protein